MKAFGWLRHFDEAFRLFDALPFDSRGLVVIAILLGVVAVAFQLEVPAANAPATHIKTVESSPSSADTEVSPATAGTENVAATVSLSGMLTLQDVCTEIEKQTGNKIIDYRDHLHQKTTNPSFKLEIKDAPFWQAVDALLDATNMTVYRYSGKEGLAIVDRSADELPRAAAPPTVDRFGSKSIASSPIANREQSGKARSK